MGIRLRAVLRVRAPAATASHPCENAEVAFLPTQPDVAVDSRELEPGWNQLPELSQLAPLRSHVPNTLPGPAT
jgi:hypothetical protein